ncbi:MAG: DUF4367 domain-containing protein [Sedimentibacter sp.]|uniref:DUF4367 domain-containing protein n=1 Tax=Sedimentibacter sp. TaxID=1960295 RepID=UPI0031584CCC
MNRNHTDNFNDDFLIKKAALSLVEKDNEMFDLLDKDDTIINPSQDELDKKIYSMINERLGEKTTKLIKQKKFKKLISKVAILVLLLTSGFAIPFITVDAFREKIINFYIENFDSHASFMPKEESPFNDFKVGYIPEGYLENDEIKTPSFYSLTYYNKENYLIDVTLYDSKSSFNVDIENCEKYNITVNNKNGYIYRKPGSTILIFKFHENSIVITSTNDSLTNEELIKIADSIK